MSKMIPKSVVDVLRGFVDISIGVYGISCTLKVVKYPDEIDYNDVDANPEDFVYTEYTTQVWVSWSPNKYKLRKLGIFVEGDIPMICWFANKIEVEGKDQDVDIVVGSYFIIEPEYVPDSVDAEEFEIVDVIIPEMHDAVITKAYKIAPRRVKQRGF